MNDKAKRWMQLGSIAAVLILSLQNCSDFEMQEQIYYEHGLFETMKFLDSKSLPVLLGTEELVTRWKTGQGDLINKSIFADQMSLVVAADRSATGELVKANSGAGSEEVSIRVEGDRVLAVKSNSSGTTYSEILSAPLPSGGDKMVLAASFGAKSASITLLVNGVVQKNSIQTTGTPFDFSFLMKQVVSKPASGNVLEYVVFAGDSLNKKGRLTASELNVMSRHLAMSNEVANVVFDPSLIDGGVDGGGGGGNPVGTAPNPFFAAAKAVFDSKCLSCHGAGMTWPQLSNLTESSALGNGWVIRGKPEASTLYYRLQTATGGPGPRDMPKGGSISAAEAQAVADWIRSIQ